MRTHLFRHNTVKKLGLKMDTERVVRNVIIGFGDAKHTLDLMIVDSVPDFDVILGRDWYQSTINVPRHDPLLITSENVLKKKKI